MLPHFSSKFIFLLEVIICYHLSPQTSVHLPFSGVALAFIEKTETIEGKLHVPTTTKSINSSALDPSSLLSPSCYKSYKNPRLQHMLQSHPLSSLQRLNPFVPFLFYHTIFSLSKGSFSSA